MLVRFPKDVEILLSAAVKENHFVKCAVTTHLKLTGGWLNSKKKDKIAHSARGWQEEREEGYLRGQKNFAHIRTVHTYNTYVHTYIHPYIRTCEGKRLENCYRAPLWQSARRCCRRGVCLFVFYCDVFGVPAVLVGTWAHSCLFGLCLPNVCVSACLCVDGIEVLIGSLQYSKRQPPSSAPLQLPKKHSVMTGSCGLLTPVEKSAKINTILHEGVGWNETEAKVLSKTEGWQKRFRRMRTQLKTSDKVKHDPAGGDISRDRRQRTGCFFFSCVLHSKLKKRGKIASTNDLKKKKERRGICSLR